MLTKDKYLDGQRRYRLNQMIQRKIIGSYREVNVNDHPEWYVQVNGNGDRYTAREVDVFIAGAMAMETMFTEGVYELLEITA